MKKPKVKSQRDYSARSNEIIEKIKKKMTPARKDYLLKEIKRLAKLEDEAFRPRHGRFDFYDYLEEVLKLNWDWADKGARKTRGRQVGVLIPRPLPPRKGRTALHFLIEASSKQNKQIKSRWVQALMFASQNRQVIEADCLAAFIAKHGGIAGCAAKAANPKRPLKLKVKLNDESDDDRDD